MSSVPLIVGVAVCAVATSVVTVQLTRSTETEDGVSRAELDTLRREVAALRECSVGPEDLRAALQEATRFEMRAALASVPRDVPTSVAREAGEERPSATPAAVPANAAPEGAREDDPSQRTPERWLELLQATRGNFDRTSALWKEILAAGRYDEIIAALQAVADRQPNNPEPRFDLGTAYLQRVFAETGPAQGEWAMRADGAFDAALAIDPTHWGARFTKAVSLANWPAFLGKTGGAIREFETLIEQQRAETPAPHHAQPYLYLGNLYLNRGQLDKAREIWNQGLSRFPQDASLRQQLDTNR